MVSTSLSDVARFWHPANALVRRKKVLLPGQQKPGESLLHVLEDEYSAAVPYMDFAMVSKPRVI